MRDIGGGKAGGGGGGGCSGKGDWIAPNLDCACMPRGERSL